MSNRDEILQRLKNMLDQTSPGGLEAAIAAPARAGTSGFESTDGAADLGENRVRSALEKMAMGREAEVTFEEQSSLEAIVMPENRPVVFVREKGYDDLPGIWTGLNEAAPRERLQPLLGAVGRIELPHASWIPYGGTGFVVGPGLLMTNRHVAKLFSDGLGQTIRYNAGDAVICTRRFQGGNPDDATDVFRVAKVEMVHPYWDMALLRVEGLNTPPLSISTQTPEELRGRQIVAVGYPAQDPRNDLALQNKIFGTVFNVKRMHPGLLQPRSSIRSFETDVSAVTHDSSTLGGNSGSAIIDVETGQVVALHFAGVYLKANYGVPMYELARDSRVVATGVNFTGSVHATDQFDKAWRRAGVTETVAATPNGAAAQKVAPAASPATTVKINGASSSAAGVTLTVPLTISISLGQPDGVNGASVETLVAPEEAPHMAAPVVFSGLESRKGFQPGFLDLANDEEVPLPDLTGVGRSAAAKLEDGSYELKYHKFSVVMHKGRRLAIFAAANVDWQPSHRLVAGQKPTRKELTGLDDGTQEMWVTDWRIPAEHQLPDSFFTKDNGAFDKGHIVRRDDVCWGSSFKDMQKGNGDTYHTTNCSPQTAAFNRSASGEDNWGDLENLVQTQTKAEKAITFAGPVLGEDDRLFAGRDDSGAVRVQIPSRFWKIIVVKGENGPAAYGFVLEQDLSDVPLEFAVPTPWQRYLVPIEEIEGYLNGLARLDWLKRHDAGASDEGVARKVGRRRR